jgi:hypothetical protein
MTCPVISVRKMDTPYSSPGGDSLWPTDKILNINNASAKVVNSATTHITLF